MALDLSTARKDLSADSLFQLLRSRFASLPDPRAGVVEIPLGDALMSAFAMFSLKDPSLLAFDQRRRNPKDNFRTLYGIDHVPPPTRRERWRCAGCTTNTPVNAHDTVARGVFTPARTRAW